jgi:uncharacterized protein (DUF1810 family)
MAHLSDATALALERFLDAQASVYDEVVNELRLGKKQTHWMWFIFPQLVDLGRSVTARKYGIFDLQEARDFLRHPVLGARLRTCCELLLSHPALTAEAMLGHIDATKLWSCATLFLHASGGEPVFQSVLDTFYEGIPDPLTQDILSHR